MVSGGRAALLRGLLGRAALLRGRWLEALEILEILELLEKRLLQECLQQPRIQPARMLEC